MLKSLISVNQAHVSVSHYNTTLDKWPKCYRCTNPNKKLSYKLIVAGPKHKILYPRHVAVSPQSVDTTDKFRIHMFEEGTNEVIFVRVYIFVLNLTNCAVCTPGLSSRISGDGCKSSHTTPCPSSSLSLCLSIYHFIFEKSAVQHQICHLSIKRHVTLLQSCFN